MTTSIPQQCQYMNLRYTRSFFSYANDAGVPLQPLLEIFGINDTELADDDHRVSVECLDRGFALLEQLTGNPNVGMQCGLYMSPAHLGVLGMLLLTCRQTSELFDLHTRYGKLISNATWPEYTHHNGLICMTLHEGDRSHKLSRHRIEYSLTGWMRLARWILGEPFSPVSVNVTYAAPACSAALTQWLGCPIQFDCTDTRVYFPLGNANQALGENDSRLRRMLETEARQRLQHLQGEQTETDTELAVIKRFIAERLALGVPGLANVAHHVGDSTRSLQRKLEARATRYTQLVEQVRIELAENIIGDEKISLAEMAILLGFADQSTFQRAFKRWFALTPGEYRRQRREISSIKTSV